MKNKRYKAKRFILYGSVLYFLVIANPTMAEEAIALTCVPEAGSAVMPGDTVTITLFVNDVSNAGAWGAVCVNTSADFTFLPETIESHIVADTMGSTAIVPGNDGLLLLPDQLQPDDSVSFQAVVKEDAALPSCVLQTDAFTTEAVFSIVAPEAAAPENATPMVNAEKTEGTPKVLGWWTVAGVLAAAIVIAVLYRKKLKRLSAGEKKKPLLEEEQPAQTADAKLADTSEQQ